MGFQKGRAKTGGRRPGSTNLLGKDLRGRVLDIVERNLEGLEGTLEQMEPRERVTVLLKLMEFVLPKAREAEAPQEVTESRQVLIISPEKIEQIERVLLEGAPLEDKLAALEELEAAERRQALKGKKVENLTDEQLRLLTEIREQMNTQ